MTIGIDIDDTITYTTIYANNLLKNDSQFNYVSDYHDLSVDDYKLFINKYIEKIYDSVPLKEDVVEVLQKWHNEGKKIIFITARGRDNEDLVFSKTAFYFNKNNIIYDEIIFKQKTKYEACKKNNIDIFIDDKEEVLDEISAHNIKTLRIANDSNSNHKIVKTWKEIYEYVKRWG